MTTNVRPHEEKEEMGGDLGTTLSEKSRSSRDLGNGIQRSGGKEKEESAAGAEGSAMENAAMTEKEVDVPPNGGYGWVCVAACATING